MVHVVTAFAQGAPFVPALKVLPGSQAVHTPSLVVVAGVSPLPVVQVVTVVCAQSGPMPVAENVPVAHAPAHTVSVVAVQAVFSPAVPQVAHGLHAFAFDPAFHVDPGRQALHTPFAEVVALVKPLPAGHVFTVTSAHPLSLVPAFHVDSAALQALHSPFLEVVALVKPLPAWHALIVT